MGRIVVSEFVSLDGVIEDPGWTWEFERGAEGDRFKLDELFASEALLLGRVTYQGFARAWPSITDDAGFADKMNSMNKFVVSATLSDTEATWNRTTVLRGDARAEVSELKARTRGDIPVEGSGQLVHSLINYGLVDELRLMVFPIVLGKGKQLFPDVDEPVKFVLTDATSTGTVSLLVYRPAEIDSSTAGQSRATSDES
jgi:dihydrofolate reductase